MMIKGLPFLFACLALSACLFQRQPPAEVCIDLADYTFYALGCDQDAAAPGCASVDPNAAPSSAAVCPSAEQAQSYVQQRFHVTPEGTDIVAPDAHPEPSGGQCCY